MNIVFEIGLNHLGSKKELEKYFTYLDNFNYPFSLSLQIIKKKFLIENKLYKYHIDDEYLVERLINFKKKKKIKIGIATDKKINSNILKDLDFIKILSKDFYNKSLINYYKKQNCPFYISTAGIKKEEIKIKFKALENNKSFKSFIITEFSQNIKKLGFNKIIYLNKNQIFDISYGSHYNDYNFPLLISQNLKIKNFFLYIKLNNLISFPDDNHAISLNNLNLLFQKIEYFNKFIK